MHVSETNKKSLTFARTILLQIKDIPMLIYVLKMVIVTQNHEQI